MVGSLGVSVIKIENSDNWDTTLKKRLAVFWVEESGLALYHNCTQQTIDETWFLSPTHLPYSPRSSSLIYSPSPTDAESISWMHCLCSSPLLHLCPGHLPSSLASCNDFELVSLSLILALQWDKSNLRKYKSEGDTSLLKFPRCRPLLSEYSPNSLICLKKPIYIWPLSILQHHH